MPPRNKAGENVPPKKPNPIQQLVNTNLHIKRSNKKEKSKFAVITLSNVLVPNPKTSSMNNPKIPQSMPAITGACQFKIPNFFGIDPA